MSEDKIKKQAFIIEHDKLSDKFDSKCICCGTHKVSPFDFKCVLINKRLDMSINNVIPVCKNCYSKSSKKPHTAVYKKVQELAYKKYYGTPSIKCFCCRDETITPFNFVAGHVIARARGGEYTVDNIKPICNLCNGSMGVQNMYEFMRTYLCINIYDVLSNENLLDDSSESDDSSIVSINSDNSDDKPINQKTIIDDAKQNGKKSIYGDYVLIESNNSLQAQGKNIKERIKIIANKKWTLKKLFTDKQYSKIKITNMKGNTCYYDLSKLRYDVSHDYLKFVKP